MSQDPSGRPPGGLYYIHTKRGNPLKLQTSATIVDFFPVGSGEHRFIQRTTWHPGAESEMITYGTVVKSEMIYKVNNYIANGAEVIGYNLDQIDSTEYSPLAC